MIKDSYYKKNAKNATCVENEIEVMSSLDHVNIVKMIDHGSEGNILKKSGKGLVDIQKETDELIEMIKMFSEVE